MTWARQPPRVRQYEGANPSSPRAPALRIDDGKARAHLDVPKENPYRSEAYLRRVAALPCAHCGRSGPSQAAHSDTGKGLQIKASDLETYPLCADSPGRRGCHALIGSTGLFTRDQRRTLEQRYIAETRRTLGDAS